MTETITEDTVVVAEDHLHTELDGEVVILHRDADLYYGLNEVGAFIWELVQDPRRVEAIHERLVEEYDVDAERCRRDLHAVLSDLHEVDLVTFDDDQTT